MSQREEFQIIYDGPSLSNNEIDVKDLAPALLAISDILEEANRILFQEATQVQVNVKGSFKTGSFHVDFALVQSLASQLNAFINSDKGVTAVAVLAILGFNGTNGFGLLYLIKWLKNRKIKKITKKGDGVSVIEVDDESKEVEDQVIELFQNIKIRQSLEVVINKPLTREGIDVFAVQHGKEITEVKKEEKDYFLTPIIGDEALEDQVIETHLQAVSISFLEDNKWRFTDGNVTFYAEVKDEGFIKRVQENKESFSKDDILEVQMRKVQWVSDVGIKTDYQILKVVSHRPAAKQIPLPIEDAEDEEKA